MRGNPPAHVKESATLAAARQRLSRAESAFESANGLAHLEEGLAVLEQVLLEGTAPSSAEEKQKVLEQLTGMAAGEP